MQPWGGAIRGLDTNLLVRWLVDEDGAPHQTEIVRRLLSAEDGPFWVGPIVLAEIEWVMDRTCKGERDQIAKADRALLGHPRLLIGERDAVERAVSA